MSFNDILKSATKLKQPIPPFYEDHISRTIRTILGSGMVVDGFDEETVTLWFDYLAMGGESFDFNIEGSTMVWLVTAIHWMRNRAVNASKLCGTTKVTILEIAFDLSHWRTSVEQLESGELMGNTFNQFDKYLAEYQATLSDDDKVYVKEILDNLGEQGHLLNMLNKANMERCHD